MGQSQSRLAVTLALAGCVAPNASPPPAARIDVPAPPPATKPDAVEPVLDPVSNPPVPFCTVIADDVATRFCDRPWIGLAADAEGLEPRVLVSADAGVKLRFELASKASAAFVRFAAAGVEVRGYTPLAKLGFALTKAASALDGHATLIEGAAVTIADVEERGIRVQAKDDLIDVTEVDFRAACDALGYAPLADDAVITDWPEAPSYANPTVHALPLSAIPGGPPIATLRTPDADGDDDAGAGASANAGKRTAPLALTLGVLARDGANLHVRINGRRTRFDGWVHAAHAAATRTLRGGGGSFRLGCGGIRDDMGHHEWLTVTGDTRAVVGSDPSGPVASGVLFHAGAVVEVRRREEGWAAVRPATDVLRPANDATFWLPLSVLRAKE